MPSPTKGQTTSDTILMLSAVMLDQVIRYSLPRKALLREDFGRMVELYISFGGITNQPWQKKAPTPAPLVVEPRLWRTFRLCATGLLIIPVKPPPHQNDKRAHSQPPSLGN